MNKMKKLFSLLTMALLVIAVIPVVFAAGSGGSLGGSIGVEEFEPLVFQCGNRILIDDDVQPWRITDRHTKGTCTIPSFTRAQCAANATLLMVNGVCTAPAFTDEESCERNRSRVWVPILGMVERNQQYLFDGERYQVEVLVFDKNKIQDDMVDLVLEGEERCTVECINRTCVPTCEQFDDKMINCVPIPCEDHKYRDGDDHHDGGIDECNVRIDEQEIDECDPETMQKYLCTVDILDSEHMYGTYWLKVRAISGLTDTEGEYDEIARWFINPIISLSVDGDLDFSDVRPGTASYSTVLLKNTAEGGVLLDMFITGDDWPAADEEMGRCLLVDSDGKNHVPATYVNYLPLGAFSYYTENGAYSTRDDMLVDDGNYGSAGLVRAFSFTDTNNQEGYLNIHRQVNAGFEEAMFDEAEIIQANPISIGIDPTDGGPATAYLANILYPGSAGMSLTFRLMLPEPCYGQFESGPDGSIFFWGEAI